MRFGRLQMLDEDEYPSDSDQSDEDYNPDGKNSEAGSEVESDGDAESGDEVVLEQSKSTKTGKRKGKSQGQSKRKSRRFNNDSEELELARNEDVEKVAENQGNEDAEKQHADALWADFLSDTTDVRPDPPKPVSKDPKPSEAKANESSGTSKVRASETEKAPEKRTITEIFDFAGEKVEVEKVVEVDNKSASASTTSQQGPKAIAGRSNGGLGSILNQLGGAKKISVLEKSKLDWTSFKRNEGIQNDLETHNRGRDGFLERQDFLQRTDLRQFEIEKNQRMSSRRK